jgi:dihydrofolate reductase
VAVSDRRPTRVNDLDSALAAATSAAGDKYVNILGADIARQCLAMGAVDELVILIAPSSWATASACSTTPVAPTSH